MPADAVASDRSMARPTNNVDQTGISRAAERRLVGAMVGLSAGSGRPLRRAEARAIIRSRATDGLTLDELEAYMRATYHLDPVGVAVAREVDRQRGEAR